MNRIPLLRHDMVYEQDVVLVRQRTRQLAAALGSGLQDQARLATAVSEIARNAFQYAGGGRVEFFVDGGPPAMMVVRVSDSGGGIARLDDVLAGRYVSPTGMGIGISGARRLSDLFEVKSAPDTGTAVTLGKELPERTRVTPAAVERVVATLARDAADDPLAELQEQNRELIRVLAALRESQAEQDRLARELAETNRGVLALYAELDERANHLERADQLKTRFLSDLNHEIRTPLNAVRNVARLLLDGYEGALSGRQRKAVEMMRSSTNALNDLVNDWLDLARIEAGKVDLHLSDVPVDDLFAGLRALFRPLATPPGVELVFEDGARVAPLRTDESKIAQILRNFISNALKFTERGEVRVGVSDREGNMVAFMVADTGIGIAPEHLAKIFEEFAQIDNPMQRKVKGTGLGLPLSRRLAQMLGGDVTVVSDAGRGSCFTLVVPRAFVEAEQTPALERSHA